MKEIKDTFLKLGFECDNPKFFLISQWQKGDKCLIFVVYRVVIAAFFIFSHIHGLMHYVKNDQILVSFIYLTRINMTATVITCTIAAYYAVSFYFKEIHLRDRMTLGLKFYWLMHTNTVTFACAVSLLYWVLLYGNCENTHINLYHVLQHITNSLVLLIDLLVIHHEHRIWHFVYPIIFGTFYFAFTIVYPYFGGVNARGHNYVYPVLDWKNNPKKALIVAFATYLMLFVLHLIICGIAKIKQLIHNC